MQYKAIAIYQVSVAASFCNKPAKGGNAGMVVGWGKSPKSALCDLRAKLIDATSKGDRRGFYFSHLSENIICVLDANEKVVCMSVNDNDWDEFSPLFFANRLPGACKRIDGYVHGLSSKLIAFNLASNIRLVKAMSRGW